MFQKEGSDSIENSNADNVYTSLSGFSGNFTKNEIKEMEKDSSNEIFLDKKVFALLDFSAEQIGAIAPHNLIAEGVNLTGAGQTVCVIDTGVNYNLPELGGGCYGNNNPNLNCTVLGGYDFVNSDSDPMDDNGHGTHVASIIASSNSTYQGISPSAKIIAIKVLNGTGIGTESDVLAGIDWCIANASKFNISVISMSLGDYSINSTYCDLERPLYSQIINLATSHGIAVVSAAGNLNSYIGIAAPACIENAIAVGAVNDADEIYYQRGPLFELLAPGINIFSPGLNGNYEQFNGTSASTPHVASSITLLQQLSKIQSGNTLSVSEIKNILSSTGKVIDDTASSGYNFSRINIFDAILSIDEVAPEVDLILPEDEEIDSNGNKTFVCNFSDWQLSNVTLKIWNSTGLFLQESESKTGTANESVFNVTSLPSGNYEWNCLVSDVKNNYNSASNNFTFTVGGIHASLYTPENDTYTNSNETIFSCGGESETRYELKNATFYLWNNAIEIYSKSKEISSFQNLTNFSSNFSDEGDYKWGCIATNNNSDFSAENYTIHFDQTSPIISGLEITPTVSSVEIIWNTNEISNTSSSIGENSSSMILNHSVTASSLSPSTTYNFEITSCDRAGNCMTNSSSFETLPSSSHSPSSSSSVESSENVALSSPAVSEKITSGGKNKEVRINQKILFDIGDGVNRSLILAKVEDDKVLILIEPNGIFLNITLGASEKINLSSTDYYDLLIKIENISDKKANISLYKIYEQINKEDGRVFAMGNTVTEPNQGDNIPKYFSKQLIILLLSLFSLVVVSVFVLVTILISKIHKEHKS